MYSSDIKREWLFYLVAKKRAAELEELGILIAQQEAKIAQHLKYSKRTPVSRDTLEFIQVIRAFLQKAEQGGTLIYYEFEHGSSAGAGYVLEEEGVPVAHFKVLYILREVWDREAQLAIISEFERTGRIKIVW